MTLSVIIVNYNVRDLLLDALSSLRGAMEGIDGEIIVVDNASTDGAVEAIRRDYPAIITIPLNENIGFGRANNVGIERSRGEFILLLNPDTIVQEDTLSSMLEFMRDHPAAAAAGCRILRPDGSIDLAARRGFPSIWAAFSRVFGLARLFPKSRLFAGYNLGWLGSDSEAEVDALSGCFMFLRRDILQKVGGFDPDYFMYGEDLDLCYRIRERGKEIWYTPRTTIVHVKGESTRRSSLDTVRMFYDAMDIFVRKHHRKRRFLLPLVRLGIQVRHYAARISRSNPKLALIPVDLLAVITGLLVATLLKVGAISFPPYAVAEVLLVPPLIFTACLFLSGAYGREFYRLSRPLLGYLIGFFVLSTFPYFFQEYDLSRFIVIATTGIAAGLGIVARLAVALYDRTFGGDRIRNVGVIAGRSVTTAQRERIHGLFPGRLVRVEGVIVPRVEDLDTVEDGIGSLDGLARLIEEREITDVVIADQTLAYHQVVGAMGGVVGGGVTFHMVRSGGVTDPSPIVPGERLERSTRRYEPRPGLRSRIRQVLLAWITLAVISPLLYLLGKGRRLYVPGVISAAFGLRRLAGGVRTGANDPVFAAEDYVAVTDPRMGSEILAAHYRENSSLLLDGEIVINGLRIEPSQQSKENESNDGQIHARI